jgi:hypothetical protein
LGTAAILEEQRSKSVPPYLEMESEFLRSPVEGGRRFRWDGEQFLSPVGMAFGLERNVTQSSSRGRSGAVLLSSSPQSINSGTASDRSLRVVK